MFQILIFDRMPSLQTLCNVGLLGGRHWGGDSNGGTVGAGVQGLLQGSLPDH